MYFNLLALKSGFSQHQHPSVTWSHWSAACKVMGRHLKSCFFCRGHWELEFWLQRVNPYFCI